MREKIAKLYSIEQLSTNNTCIHRLRPGAKLLTTLVFIICVISLPKYSVYRIMPFMFYPAILIPLSETPIMLVLKRLALALPFCIMAGLSSIISVREIAYYIAGFGVSYGLLNFTAIILRALLCVSALLILIATTPFCEIAGVLHALRLPSLFVMALELTYRYISVIFGEAHNMFLSYALRNKLKPNIELKLMGAFIGQLFLRSYNRAERVYSAMLLRGYGKPQRRDAKMNFSINSGIYAVLVSALCVIFSVIKY